MPANVVGSVRRTDRPCEVVLHVEGSRAAWWAAVRLMLVLLLCLMAAALAIYINADSLRHPRGSEAFWPGVWGFGALVLLWWQIGRHIPPLLRTAFDRVTIRIDTQTLEVLTRRRVGVATLPWATSGIDDVVVVPRGGGAGELRIIPSIGRPTTLLFGLPRAELEFIAASMRDALRLTARDADVDDADGTGEDDAAGASGSSAADECVPMLPADGATLTYALPRGSLDYAAVPPEGIACDRSPAGVKLEVPPLPPAAYIAHRWPLAVAAMAIILLWGITSGSAQHTAVITLVIAAFIAAGDAHACFTRTTIEVDRSKLARTARMPMRKVGESWPVASVAAVLVVARPPSVEIRLTTGEFATLAYTATSDDAEDLAGALRRALRLAARRRDVPQDDV